MALPVETALPAVLAACRQPGAFVLVAPPGSGKTTALPPALLGVVDGSILVLQPRRAAARMAARRIAQVRGERVGGVIGYSTRFERQRSAATRVELLTEGLLLRRLQADPLLEGVGAVLLDEFHERSLAADVALAQLAELRELRPELVVGVLSATLDPGPVAAFLDAPVIEADGRSFPVDVRFADKRDERRVEDRVAAAVRRALGESTKGHVLAFLPGAGEIGRTAARLGSVDAEVLPLHGGLSAKQQDRALGPSRGRKVVLATNLAETSVTIDGVRAVIDSGLARQASWDPGLAATRLELRAISQASADQRAGRAGRTGPGLAYRLWTAAEHGTRRAFDAPEIARSDLSDVVLTLREQGADARTLRWLEAPPAGAVAAAEDELRRLGALDDHGVTALGRALATLPLPPRLGVCLLAARERGVLGSVALTLALLVERDPFRQAPPEAHPEGSGLYGRLVALAGDRGPVARVADQLVRRAERAPALAVPCPGATEDCPPLEASLLAGLGGRIARRRGPDSDDVVLAAGGAARMGPETVAPSELLLALRIQASARGRAPMVRLATPLQADWLQPTDAVEVFFDAERQAVVARRQRRLGRLLLAERPARLPESPAVAEALRVAAAADPERALKPKDGALQVLARVAWLRERRPELELPALTLVDALPALVPGRRSFEELRGADLTGALLGALTWPQRQALDRLAPASVALPTGRRRALTYRADGPPVLAARIQQLFGLADGPRVDDGRCAVLLHLLAPNQRPAQVTDDLAGFWDGSYAAVRKELRGRYPKHPWPEDPRSAPATDRAKRRR